MSDKQKAIKMSEPTREEIFAAFEKAWLDCPSQDNEGYLPDRGGFKAGWFAAIAWLNERRETTPAASTIDALEVKIADALMFAKDRYWELKNIKTADNVVLSVDEFSKKLNGYWSEIEAMLLALAPQTQTTTKDFDESELERKAKAYRKQSTRRRKGVSDECI